MQYTKDDLLNAYTVHLKNFLFNNFMGDNKHVVELIELNKKILESSIGDLIVTKFNEKLKLLKINEGENIALVLVNSKKIQVDLEFSYFEIWKEQSVDYHKFKTLEDLNKYAEKTFFPRVPSSNNYYYPVKELQTENDKSTLPSKFEVEIENSYKPEYKRIMNSLGVLSSKCFLFCEGAEVADIKLWRSNKSNEEKIKGLSYDGLTKVIKEIRAELEQHYLEKKYNLQDDIGLNFLRDLLNTPTTKCSPQVSEKINFVVRETLKSANFNFQQSHAIIGIDTQGYDWNYSDEEFRVSTHLIRHLKIRREKKHLSEDIVKKINNNELFFTRDKNDHCEVYKNLLEFFYYLTNKSMVGYKVWLKSIQEQGLCNLKQKSNSIVFEFDKGLDSDEKIQSYFKKITYMKNECPVLMEHKIDENVRKIRGSLLFSEFPDERSKEKRKYNKI